MTDCYNCKWKPVLYTFAVLCRRHDCKDPAGYSLLSTDKAVYKDSLEEF